MPASRDRNVLGGPLATCSTQPPTGWFRDGCCRSAGTDGGRHVICARMTSLFLAFSLSRGNDLVTPRPEFRFPGLVEGDRWCLCAMRWEEARLAGCAPPVILAATHEDSLEIVDKDHLLAHAEDAPSGDAGPGRQVKP